MSMLAPAPPDYHQRRQILKQKLRRKQIDAFIVTQPENRRYLSGYSAPDHGIGESSGVLLIFARGETRLLTDFRYRQQAENETDLPVILYPDGLLKLLDSLLPADTIQRCAFESHYLLHATSVRLQALANKHKIELVPVSGLVEKMRRVKDEGEIERIRRSVALNEMVFQDIYRSISADMTEIEIALQIEAAMRRSGAESPSFQTIVASGRNSALPHAVPTATAVGSGRSITIDMGLVLNGYCSDMTRNFTIGPVEERYRELHRLVRHAQCAGMAAVRAGVTAREVDRAARTIISDAGYGRFFGHALGHGVGLAVHENPRISRRSRQKLQAGMIITIEPGIYIPDWGGIRLENMVVVREDGCENLNTDTTWLDL